MAGAVEKSQEKTKWEEIPRSALAVLRASCAQPRFLQRSVQQRLEVMSEEELPKGVWQSGACFICCILIVARTGGRKIAISCLLAACCWVQDGQFAFELLR